MTELMPDTVRQAGPVFRGYNYQAYQTILSWLKCGKNEEIFTEFAEDLDIVRRDALGSITDAELTQVKHEKKRVTLRSKSAIDLINNFNKHKKRNPDLTLFIRLCTVSERGKEKKVDWVYAENGLCLWDLLKSRELSAADQNAAIEILRSFYSTNTLLSATTQSFIQESDGRAFLTDFIDRISWDTSQSSYADIENEIKQILAVLPRPIIDPLEITQVIYRLWYFVTHSIAGTPNKALNRSDLETILSEETTAKIDRDNLKDLIIESKRTVAGVENLEKMVSLMFEQTAKHLQSTTPVQVIKQQTYQSTIPPLPKPCVDRTQELTKIQGALNNRCLLWIHGSTGYGKTTLANLYSRKTSSNCFWFRLGSYSDFTLTTVLQTINEIIDIELKGNDIVILDDLFIVEQQTYSIELLTSIFDCVKNKSNKILITSRYRLPIRLKTQLGEDFFEYVAPEMSESDINLLIKRLGLDDDSQTKLWSSYILASTSGHPQLVVAFATDAKENEWIFNPNMLVKQPRTVDQVKAEGRRLLVETIHNYGARELARYLSLVIGPFDRDFALSIGNAAPDLQEPGNALDILVGPWIESLGNDIYTLSPLLRGYAAADAGKDGLNKYYVVLCLAWLKKTVITPFEVSQAMITALNAKFDPLIAKLCGIMFTTNSEDFKTISKELFILPRLYLESGDQLTDIHPMARFMFRFFQLKISENNEDWRSYLKIYSRQITEIDELDSSSMEYWTCLWMFNCETIIRTNTPIPAKDRVLQAIAVIEMINDNELSDITAILDQDKVQIDPILMIATSFIHTYQELQFLLTELADRSGDIVSSFFNGFEMFPDDLSLLIDRVWQNESNNDNPEWDQCITVFYEAMEFAKRHGNKWLLSGAARGLMIIYEEYLGDSAKALQVADKSRSLLCGSHPLIDIQEATIHYRSDHYEKVIEIIGNLESSLSPEILPIHRIYALRSAIRCAGELKQWDKVIYFAEHGLRLSPHLNVDGLGELSLICFEAELGWSEHEKGDLNKAVKHFELVLKKMEQVSDQEYPLFNIFRIRFGSALGWLSHTWELNGTVIQLKTSILRPFAGMFANFQDPPDESKVHTVQAYPLLWANLAKYSASFIDMDFIDSIAKRSNIRIGSKQTFLAVTGTYHAIFLNSLVNNEFNRSLEAGMEYAKLFTRLSYSITMMSDRFDLNEPMDMENLNENHDRKYYDKWFKTLSWIVIEPMIMFICGLDEQPKINFSKWVDHFKDTFGKQHRYVKYIRWVEKSILAAYGDSGAIEMVKKNTLETSNESGSTRRLSILAMCASSYFQISATLSAQFSMLKAMTLPGMGNNHWGIFFYMMVIKRWSDFAKNQKFLMVLPELWSAKILDSIAISSPTASDIAKLLLLVGEANAVSWPQEMLSDLRDISQ